MRILTFAALFALCLPAADKSLPLERTSDENVEITGSVLGKEQARQELGAPLPQGVVVLRVTVRPLTEKAVHIDRDDFTLLSTSDGQRSSPYAPSQIAGSATLVVTSAGARGGGMMSDSGGPLYGGYPGTGTNPRRMAGEQPVMGNADSHPGADSTLKRDEKSGRGALLAALEQKILPEKDISDTTSGLLYFQMEGKAKPKDLELIYKSTSGRLMMRFRP